MAEARCKLNAGAGLPMSGRLDQEAGLLRSGHQVQEAGHLRSGHQVQEAGHRDRGEAGRIKTVKINRGPTCVGLFFLSHNYNRFAKYQKACFVVYLI